MILTCATPVSQHDFLLFGNVSWYSGCIFTPCRWPFGLLIDSDAALQAALLRPAFRKVIESLYPERAFPKPVGRQPDPGPFRPFVLPVEGDPIVPQQQVKVFETAATTSGANAEAASEAPSRQIATVNTPAVRARASLSATDAASVINRGFRCQSGSLADYLLRFEDYTPTASEAAGGPYTGTGTRTTLGVTTTDRQGNYIFLFSLPCRFFYIPPIFNIPVRLPCIVPLPDIIVQVLDGTATSGVLYETAPFFNTPEFMEINVCVPKGVVTLPPACATGQIIQSIGNITVGPLVGGTRNTSNTSLDANGEITSSSSLGPQVSCAAWAGYLYFYACLSNPDIVSYTIRYGRPADADTAYQFVTEDYSPYRMVPPPVYQAQQSVGPAFRTLETEPTVFSSVPSYLNAETDTTTPWLQRWLVLKMVLTSSLYQAALGGPGPVVFRIQGYSSAGNQLADDRITLYIDNNFVDQFIDPNLALITTAGPVAQSNCALFTLPADQPAAPLQISFRANQYEGFMASYSLVMEKGATGNFPIQGVSGTPPITASGSCGFTGTSAEPGYDSVTNELTVQVAPAAGANWLAPGQTFCAFSIYVNSSVWITDGQGIFGPFTSGPDAIGIQQG